jgi:hypothetical protein
MRGERSDIAGEFIKLLQHPGRLERIVTKEVFDLAANKKQKDLNRHLFLPTFSGPSFFETLDSGVSRFL